MALLNRNSFILLDGEARILQQLLEAYLQEQAVLGCSGGDRMDVRPDTVTPAEALGTRLAAPEEEKYSMDTLTIQQAFEAMQLFLVSYYERTQSEDVGALLGDLQCMEDGVPANPAAWQDWMDCVKKVIDRGCKKTTS